MKTFVFVLFGLFISSSFAENEAYTPFMLRGKPIAFEATETNELKVVDKSFSKSTEIFGDIKLATIKYAIVKNAGEVKVILKAAYQQLGFLVHGSYRVIDFNGNKMIDILLEYGNQDEHQVLHEYYGVTPEGQVSKIF